MKISLTPVHLTAAQFEVVATAARENGVTIGEFIARTSTAAAIRALHSQQGHWGIRVGKHSRRLSNQPFPPES
ncbi:MAG: hypothetical protein ACRD2G_04850 [Terriglobia bacterium]